MKYLYNSILNILNYFPYLLFKWFLSIYYTRNVKKEFLEISNDVIIKKGNFCGVFQFSRLEIRLFVHRKLCLRYHSDICFIIFIFRKTNVLLNKLSIIYIIRINLSFLDWLSIAAYLYRLVHFWIINWNLKMFSTKNVISFWNLIKFAKKDWALL